MDERIREHMAKTAVEAGVRSPQVLAWVRARAEVSRLIGEGRRPELAEAIINQAAAWRQVAARARRVRAARLGWRRRRGLE